MRNNTSKSELKVIQNSEYIIPREMEPNRQPLSGYPKNDVINTAESETKLLGHKYIMFSVPNG